MLAAAGCGGGGPRLSHAAYEQRVAAVFARLPETVWGPVGRTAQAADAEQARPLVEQAQRGLRDAADELERLRPPQKAEPGHDAVVRGLRGVADDLGRIAGRRRAAQAQPFAGFDAEVAGSAGAEQLRRGVQQLARAGYRISPRRAPAGA